MNATGTYLDHPSDAFIMKTCLYDYIHIMLNARLTLFSEIGIAKQWQLSLLINSGDDHCCQIKVLIYVYHTKQISSDEIYLI